MNRWILAPWILTLLLAALAFLITFRQERKLKLPRYYLAFFALAGLTQLACLLWWPRHYPLVFWICEVAHNCLLCLLCLEVIADLLPRRYVLIWSLTALLILVVSVAAQLPSDAADVLLNVSMSASYTGGVLLVLLFFLPVAWTREYKPEYKLVTAGVLAVLLGNLVASLGMKHFIRERLPEVRVGAQLISEVQLAPLVGLVLLSLAGQFKRHPSDRGRRRLAAIRNESI